MENINYVASNIANVTANVATNFAANMIPNNTSVRSSSVLWWVIGIFVVLGAIGYAIYVKLQSVSPSTAGAPVPETIATGQTWCFVGEDVTGRHCVQVPSTASCDPERTFTSSLACGTVSS